MSPAGYLVEKIYQCHCGCLERFRAADNVPQYAHYCGSCAEALPADVKNHLVRVARSERHPDNPDKKGDDA